MLKKYQLSESIASKLKITESEALVIYKSVCECIEETLIQNDYVSLGDLGKLIKVKKRSRVVMNNLQGTKICVGQREKIEFKPSKKLKRII